jgi:bis(5'-adenosyl)-triphosphatase
MTEADHSTCPFCNTSILSSVFYEQDGFMAIYNIAPVLPGHSLIIPAKHYASLLDMTQSELYNFLETSRTALRILLKAFNTDAFDWSIQEKPEAGQTIEHLHLHIVPRLKGDLRHPGDWYPLVQQNDNEIIDSMDRSRLNEEAMRQIILELREIASQMK